MELQNQYNEYSFIDSSEAREVEDESEAITKWYNTYAYIQQLSKRSYESPFRWYFVIFKPFNKSYSKDRDWFMHKSLDSTRKYFKKPRVLIGTKEIEAAKVHVNWLVCTDQKLVDGRNTSRHKLKVIELGDIGDRRRILDYILKEASLRQFQEYKDYIIYPRYL